MEIPLCCSICLFPLLGDQGEEVEPPDYRVYKRQVNNSSIYELNCAFGHVTKFHVQELNFQVLFEIALNAVADGYFREAVTSGTSALERYREFFCRVAARINGVSEEEFAAAWKRVKKSSENQLGMFMAFNMSVFKKFPELMQEDRGGCSVSFRNRVIHNGDIPTESEAIAYLEGIYKLIAPTLDLLYDQFNAAVWSECEKTWEERLKPIEHEYRSTVSLGSTLRVLSRMSDTPDPIKSRIIDMKKGKMPGFHAVHPG